MINYSMGSCMNLKEFHLCGILYVFHLKSDENIVIDIGYNKSKMKRRFWDRHRDWEEREKRKKKGTIFLEIWYHEKE